MPYIDPYERFDVGVYPLILTILHTKGVLMKKLILFVLIIAMTIPTVHSSAVGGKIIVDVNVNKCVLDTDCGVELNWNYDNLGIYRSAYVVNNSDYIVASFEENVSYDPHISYEFNLEQDVAGARVIFGCGVPVVQLPCSGVVDIFYTSRPELEYWLKGKNALCDYLAENTIQEAESYAAGKPWTRAIWDVTAVAWLLNKDNRFMRMELRHSPIPEYDDRWAFDHGRHLMAYAAQIYRDRLFEDLFRKLAGG